MDLVVNIIGAIGVAVAVVCAWRFTGREIWELEQRRLMWTQIHEEGARSARAVELIDTWLRDESPHDGLRQQLVWKHLREIRAALVGDGDA